MSNHDYNAIPAEQYNGDWRDAYAELGVLTRVIGLLACLFGPVLMGLFFLSEFTELAQVMQFITAGFLVPVGWFLAISFRNWLG